MGECANMFRAVEPAKPRSERVLWHGRGASLRRIRIEPAAQYLVLVICQYEDNGLLCRPAVLDMCEPTSPQANRWTNSRRH